MRKSLVCAAFAATTLPFSAAADCGEVSIMEMNRASAQVVAAVASFLMEQGDSREVTEVPSDAAPAVASVAEQTSLTSSPSSG